MTDTTPDRPTRDRTGSRSMSTPVKVAVSAIPPAAIAAFTAWPFGPRWGLAPLAFITILWFSGVRVEGRFGTYWRIGTAGIVAAAAAWYPFPSMVPTWLTPAATVVFLAAWYGYTWGLPVVSLRSRFRPPAPRPGRAKKRDPFLLEVAKVKGTGAPYRIDLSPGRHLLVAGATGSGKGGVVWTILRELAPLVADGLVRLILIDPKGGMELALAQPLATKVQWGDGDDADERIADLLEAEAKEVGRIAAWCRQNRIRDRKVTPENPVTVIIIDELLAITDEVLDLTTKRRIEKSLLRILRQGRAPGWVVVGCTQDPAKDAIGKNVANAFVRRVCLRVTYAEQVDMVLGPKVRTTFGADAHRISPKTPGVAYVWDDEANTATLVRFPWVSDEEIERFVDANTTGVDRDDAVPDADLFDDTDDVADAPEHDPEPRSPEYDRLVRGWPSGHTVLHLDEVANILGQSRVTRADLVGWGVPTRAGVSKRREPGGAPSTRPGVALEDLDGSPSRS